MNYRRLFLQLGVIGMLAFCGIVIARTPVAAEDGVGIGVPSITVTMPVLTVTQTVSAEQLASGGTATITVVVQNTGTGDAQHVLLSGTLSNGLQYADAGGTLRTWNLGDVLMAGKNVSLSFPVVAPTVTAATETTSMVSVSADQVTPVTATNTMAVTVPAELAPAPTSDVRVHISPQSFVTNPGEQRTQATVTVKNAGTGAATGVSVRVVLPAGVTFSDTGAATHTWQVDTLAAGQAIELPFSFSTGDVVSPVTEKLAVTVVGDSVATERVTAPIEVRAGSVLGATTTLPETGVKQMSLAVWLLGLILVVASMAIGRAVAGKIL